MTDDTKKPDSFMKSHEEAVRSHKGEGLVLAAGPFPKGTGKSTFGQQERLKRLMDEGGYIDMEAPRSAVKPESN